ncbi:MAG: hypothetical protein JWM93_552 [Frankiales bacterium]|nr:hypothetical protein [Frankiales bacterium]
MPDRTSSTRAARKRLIADLLASDETLSAQMLDRMRAEIPAYVDRDPHDVLPAVVSSLRDILVPLGEGRPLVESELATFGSYGETRARQGVPLEELLQAWRLSIREVLDALVTVGRRNGVRDGELIALTRDLLTTTDAATLAFTQGHHRAEFELARREQHRRADFVRGILLATLGPAEIRQQAHRYGLEPDRDYRPVRARPTDAMPVESIERLLGLTFDSSRPRGLAAIIDGDVAGFVDHSVEGSAAAAVGIGEPARLEHIQPSFGRATRAMATATAFGLTGVYGLGDLGLLPAILADTDVADGLAQRYIAPLGVRDASQPILDTVRQYLSLSMRADVTAEHLSVHHNTVRYRVRRYEELTGIDLRDPNRALEAWWALQNDNRVRTDPLDAPELL